MWDTAETTTPLPRVCTLPKAADTSDATARPVIKEYRTRRTC